MFASINRPDSRDGAANRGTVMGYRCVVTLAALVSVIGATRTSQSDAAPRRASNCTTLNRDLDQFSKSLAMNFAEGIGDDSAARATMREAEYGNLLARVKLTMDLMRDNQCKLPESVPTGEEYASSAIACQTDKMSLGVVSPASCDQSKWKRTRH